MTADALDALIARGESLALEFKREANDDELVEAVVCLANGGGGTILVGVDDDGTVRGAKRRHGKTTDPRRVEAMVSSLTRPAHAVEVELASTRGVEILVVRVPPASMAVATAKGKYLRRALGGDGRPACVPLFIYELGQGHAHDPSTAMVAGATWKDLDRLEIERFRRLVRESGARGDRALIELSDEDLCRALGGLEGSGKSLGIRRLALLLFGREDALRRQLPTHEVAWQVLEGQRVLENDIDSRPLLRSFEELTQRFRARNRSTELVNLFRTEIPDFSEEAFREALANAMTHRDYSELGAIHVQWTDEGIRIANPGGLPEGVRLDNLLVTQPRPRNPMLADAFKRAGIVERTGRGVDTIFYGQLRYGRSVPRYLATEKSVSVTLPGGAANLELVRWVVSEGRAGRRWELFDLLLLRTMTEHRRMTTEEAARVMQTDVESARTALARLVDAGLIEARGEGKGRSYHLSAAMYRTLGDRAGYVHTAGFEPLQQEQMVLRYAKKHGKISRGDAAELCRLSLRQASHLLKKLSDRGLLKSVGLGRNSHYVAM